MASSRLSRELSLSDAVVLGLGSMMGAGIFASLGPAAQSAGAGLIVSVFLAATAAFLNATSVAQLAALFPESGGAYVYGRKQWGPFTGFLAGWAFVIGKSASCAAMALTFAHYMVPQHPSLTAAALLLALTAINYFGIQKTVFATRWLVAGVLATLALTLALPWFSDPSELQPFTSPFSSGWTGVFEGAGLLFFAFAGYARIATLGEEVREPRRTIPKAIALALGMTFVVYLLVVGTVLAFLPLSSIASGSQATLAMLVESSSFPQWTFLVRWGAGLASLSVLLSLIAGISRTLFAMGSQKDMPRFLAAVHPKYKVPHRAELTIGLLLSLLVTTTDLRSAIGFSSFAVLLYYAIANTSAIRLKNKQRFYPQLFAFAGLGICLALAFSLPTSSVVRGSWLMTLGATYYLIKDFLSLKTTNNRLAHYAEPTVGALFALWPRSRPTAKQFHRAQLIAHRGAKNPDLGILENTLSAFSRCLDHGVYGIELDVRWTQDNQPVITHDDNTERVFGKNLSIGQVSLKELQQTLPELPSLEDVVHQFGKKLHMMIEIKELPNKAQVERVREVLAKLKPIDDYHLITLNKKFLEPFVDLPSEAFLSVSFTNPGAMSQIALDHQWGGVTGHFLLLNSKIFKRHRDKNQKIGTGFVSSRNLLFRELKREADWLFTNDALKMQAIIDKGREQFPLSR